MVNKTKRLPNTIFASIRHEMGLSKSEMARLLELSIQSYVYLEEVAGGCAFEILSKLVKATGKDWEYVGSFIDRDAKKNK